jgi:hypothetical protein
VDFVVVEVEAVSVHARVPVLDAPAHVPVVADSSSINLRRRGKHKDSY